MQALQLPALFIFQADEKNKRRRVSQHSLRRTFSKGISQKAYQNDMSRQLYSVKTFRTFCVFSLLTVPYVFSLHASVLGLISYSGFSVVPAVPGFADFFS